MPDTVAKHFEGAVRSTAWAVHRQRPYAGDLKDITQEAWLIALDRWQFWSDQIPGAKADLKFRLHHRIDARLKAEGWKQRRQADGSRKWMTPVKVTTCDPDVMAAMLADSVTEADEDYGLRLAADWAPMGRKQRERYARILMERYPVLVVEFETVANLPKPSNLSYQEHERRKEATRGRLRVKYAVELATARYAVEGFGAVLEPIAA
jgi:hypothetical protein